MRILFVGDSLSAQYVTAFYNEVKKRRNIEAELFDYGSLRKQGIVQRFELHYKDGILIRKTNKKLLKQVESKHYDLVIIYYSTILFGYIIKAMKKCGCKVVMYCNDNPFSTGYRSYIWRQFKRQIPYYDIIYAYRRSNIDDYISRGAKRVELLRSYYISERNYYIPDEEIELDVPSVVYIGHNENDDREDYIKALLDSGIDIGLNHAWEEFHYKEEQIHIFPREVATLKYNEILNKAKIAIVFLSKLNGDTYTRRCFEIPATKTLMIAPYTEELSKMYLENEEAVFFESQNELVEKVKYYLTHDEERRKIAEAGYQRLMKSRNEVSDRVDKILADFYSLN